MSCPHTRRAVFGPGTAQAMAEGFTFTKCSTCWEERDMTGRLTLPATAYTEKPIPWSQAAVALGYVGESFAEAARRLPAEESIESAA
jgi:hypothetical protein